jgi:hypothetical protein
MNSHYSELKDLPQLRGSLNTIVSIKTNIGMKRPPSLSESYAWDPDNIERLNYVQQKEAAAEAAAAQVTAEAVAEAAVLPEIQIAVNREPDTETRILNFILRLLFHISLISVFESVFFFFYVSTLEDTGILNVVGGFINSAVSSCSNITANERSFLHVILPYFINANQVEKSGYTALVQRNASNTQLMNRSWYYVGGCCGLFVAVGAYAQCRHVKIYWYKIVLENAAMITLLAIYEYMFFTTIIKPYTPITGDEIGQRAVVQLNSSCGLF